MLSKKKWLDEYNKILGCQSATKCMVNCKDCVYHTLYTRSNLLNEAAKIFRAQTLADEVIDDGK